MSAQTAAAFTYFESIRWPSSPACPYCDALDEAIALKGKSARAGLTKCRPCGKQFTGTVGTAYERSHMALHKWLPATRLLRSLRKGVSHMSSGACLLVALLLLKSPHL